jgi:hypothetical protein
MEIASFKCALFLLEKLLASVYANVIVLTPSNFLLHSVEKVAIFRTLHKSAFSAAYLQS